MNNQRTMWEQGEFRIVEIQDNYFDFDDLCGDTYNPKVNSDIDPEVLAEDLKHFTDLVNNEGVYGYELQKRSPEVNEGWGHVDSCWGFVGQYTKGDPTFDHYIVDELKSRIEVKS
jgi:hypothetical protein